MRACGTWGDGQYLRLTPTIILTALQTREGAVAGSGVGWGGWARAVSREMEPSG